MKEYLFNNKKPDTEKSESLTPVFKELTAEQQSTLGVLVRTILKNN